jgi:alpha-L-rhamnosidase
MATTVADAARTRRRRPVRGSVASSGGCELSRLRAAHRAEPLGLPRRRTQLSWWVGQDAGDRPTFRVAVRDATQSDAEVWSSRTHHLWTTVPGDVLSSRRAYRWDVEVLDGPARGHRSAPATFEIGVADDADWRAKWVAGPAHPFGRESFDPAPYLRHEFEVADVGVAARLYATALGLYRVWLNGIELTANALLRPGWTDYRRRVHHQSFDCTGALVTGPNVLAVILAKGWYAGRLGLLRPPAFYGDRPAFLAQLDAFDRDGRPHTVCATGPEWVASSGAIVASDLLRGESVDYRQEPEGWRATGFVAQGWGRVEVLEDSGVSIDPQPHDSIRVLEERRGELVREHARGPAVFDFGQNLVGWTRVESQLLPGTEVIVRHGETLTPEQLVYRDNLRGAFQEDRYADVAAGRRMLEPSFTVHGFRYAEVWGLPSTDPFGALSLPEDTTVTAVAVEAGHDRVGRFDCAHQPLAAFAESVAWTVRDNFLEVATDCPQRDERHGWLGDAGVIAPTAAYFFDVAAFLAKFAQDAADAQGDDGGIPSYVPVVPPADARPGAPGWSDGYVRILSLLSRRYADLPALERHFESLLRFLDHVDRHNPDGLRLNRVGADFGDWLSLPERDGESFHSGYAYTGAYSTSPRPIVDTAHSYRSFVQASEVAERLGEDGHARRLADRAEQIRQAYTSAFVNPDGTIRDATQTVYAQAVGFGLLQGEAAKTGADLLRELIEQRGHLTTGIHGVEHVLPVLACHGHADLAIELLLRDAMPSWLYMVSQGATTVWEKWDGIRPDGSRSTAEMNSLNHCALGACGAFLFEDLLGIRVDDVVWGRALELRPTYTRRLDWAGGAYDSPVGRIESRWEWHGEQLVHDIEVPGGVSPRFVSPDGYERRDGAGTVLAPGRHRLRLAPVGTR